MTKRTLREPPPSRRGMSLLKEDTRNVDDNHQSTVVIGYCDYHLVTNIGYCDYLLALICSSDVINLIAL